MRSQTERPPPELGQVAAARWRLVAWPRRQQDTRGRDGRAELAGDAERWLQQPCGTMMRSSTRRFLRRPTGRTNQSDGQMGSPSCTDFY